jgi:hypothetical protein
MWGAFNVVMRILNSLIGVAMILMGVVWTLQGLNLAFRVGFMVGDYHWTIYGVILALFGVAQLIWSNMRQIRRATGAPGMKDK